MIPRPPPDPYREALERAERWRAKLTAAGFVVRSEVYVYEPVAPDPRTRREQRR